MTQHESGAAFVRGLRRAAAPRWRTTAHLRPDASTTPAASAWSPRIDGKPRREVVRGRHRRAEGGLAPRRRRRRRQDRRRRRHPRRGPAGLLRRQSCSAAATRLRPGRIAVGQVFLPRTDLGAQERCRAPSSRPRSCASATPSMAGARCRSTSPCIGEKANATRPEIEQILICDPERRDVETLERDLFVMPPPHREAGARRAASPSSTSARCRPLAHLQGHVPGRAA